MKRPAVFLDRDGTIVEEVNYLSRIEDLRLFHYSLDAIRSLKENGFRVIVVTNQSGIGRGIYTEQAMHAIHARMQEELDGAIDGFYFCPHHPEECCKCRKPGIGMFESARDDLDIDLNASWMVGDKKLDVDAGRNAGMATILVLTGYGREHRFDIDDPPNYVEENLAAAAERIISDQILNGER